MARLVLQQELNKKHPFDSPEQEAALNLARTHDHVHAEFARLFQEFGISAPQYNALRILRGNNGDGVPCQEIGGQMITRMPDVTRLVDRLEETRLVERCRSQKDRRVVRVKITRKGLDLLARLDQPVLDLHQRLLGHLTPDELAELNRLLVKARRPD
jgi:DNA-binding MarR family transcriptional regulator